MATRSSLLAPWLSGDPGPARRKVKRPRLTSRRVKRNRSLWALALLALALLTAEHLTSASAKPRHIARPTTHPAPVTPPAKPNTLDPDWDGDGQPVTFAFGGDVHFPAGSNLGDRLAADPATALGPTVPFLMAGADLSMVNMESALTDGTCPDPQPKQYVFYAPSTAISAFQHAGITLITETNNHGEDCGPAGLEMALQARAQSAVPHPWDRAERDPSVHSVPGNNSRRADRDHRRYPSDRL